MSDPINDLPSVIELDEAKQYLRVTHSSEDDRIWGHCTAAYDWIKRFLNTPDFMNGDSPASYPECVRQAALIFVADLYEFKDPTNNQAIINLLYSYREELGI